MYDDKERLSRSVRSGESMRCRNCSAENPQGARFCIQCAHPFLRLCEKCGFENPAEARFCAQCAAPLGVPAPIPPKDESPAGPGGERRHLTVLFCDLVGSTAIAAKLDPEEWRETLAGFHRVAAAAITSFEGHVAKYLGDGVMAYFGWPQAHDNDAERAARAGLAILDAVAQLNRQPGHATLSARVGIDSGAVVIGQGAGPEADVFGDAPNIAARVEAAADPGTVAITGATHRLLSGLFVVEDRGEHQLKGVEQPSHLYRVVRPSGVRGRFEAATAAGGLTPFVGREDELQALNSRWHRALDGEGQVALIIGEAGIGKSRLVQRFHEQIASTPHTWIGAGAGAFFQNTPFYPVVEMLRQFLGDIRAEDQIAQLESRLELAGLKPAEAIPLIAPLLNLTLPPNYPSSALSPEQQRRRLLATLVEWVIGAARVQPLVIATEDLHWVDPSTLELIQLLVEQGASARLLLLYTARPEFHAPWPMRAHHMQITLSRLSSNDVRSMVAQVAAAKALAADTIATVVERTGGIPLFVEELTRAVLERGGESTPREIPATLHDSLMARLDRLGAAKEVIQIGAVIGSEFPYELLHAVHPIAEANLLEALGRLTDAELLYVRGIAPDAAYQFKHALIRDAAYEALLKTRRKELHLRVARTIDEKFPEIKEAHREVLARHWSEAGEIEAAITEWTRAGKAAESRNAFKEAQEGLQQALALLNLLAESNERDGRELELRESLVLILHVTRGWAAPEAIEAAERIGLLAERSGNLGRLVVSVVTRCFHANLAGDLSTAAALADQGLELARREGSPSLMAPLHTMQLITRYPLGDLAGAENHFTEVQKFIDDPVFRQSPGGYVPSVFGWASWNAWILGRADVARERIAKARAAVNPANPHDLPWSEVLSAFLYAHMRENETVEVLAAHSLDLCEKHGFPNEAAHSRCFLGHARAQLGRASSNDIALIRSGLDTLVQVGNRISVPKYLGYLADAQLRANAIGDALETVEQALNFNPEEIVERPETLRLRGEIRLKLGDTEFAEADFRSSVGLAQSMTAKAWELRATMSLARLLSDTDRRDEARTLLAEIYNWFTEGFDTADLKDARALLDRLDSES
jgi:class 3 adenylate cyclase/tetratricopeptide (TPR) repeat protein